MTAPTDIYDAVVENTAKANEALAVFFSHPTRLEVKAVAGGRNVEWYVYDDDTYDGEQLAIFETPLEAIIDWYEEAQS